MSTKLWPTGDSFDDVFAGGDAYAGEPIEDKYRWMRYPAQGMLVRGTFFATLHIDALDLLALVDSEEHERVQHAAGQRAAIRRKRERIPRDWPDWLSHGMVRGAEEETVLARAGLTMDDAKALIATKRDGEMNTNRSETRPSNN